MYIHKNAIEGYWVCTFVAIGGILCGRQFNVSPKVEFQAPVKQYNEDLLSERINN